MYWDGSALRNGCEVPRSRPSHRLVPKAGLEPARPQALPPQDSVSTNSTTSAMKSLRRRGLRYTLCSRIFLRIRASAARQGRHVTVFARQSGSLRCRLQLHALDHAAALDGLEIYANARLFAKNNAASPAVSLDRKEAGPREPNNEPEEPPPNDAPASAPRPCCSNTIATNAVQMRI